ncbi:MAG: TonB-dependent receptor [Rhodanobacteraceae bacterium]|nr:MAG: TonB-dependent receptor [Rhodanobacteraceae bacterium]
MSRIQTSALVIAVAAAMAAGTAHAMPQHPATASAVRTNSKLSPESQQGAVSPVVGRQPQPPKKRKVRTLKTIVVNGSFISKAGHSALRMNVPSRDTPFSISTYTRSFMNAVDVSNVNQLYSYMTGIHSNGITAYDLVLRGFSSGVNDQNSILVNGLPGLASRFAPLPTFGLERIDVVRGPASVLNGEEQPGGFVDLVTKKPQAEPAYEFLTRARTYDGAGVGFTDSPGIEAAVDLTGPIDTNKRVLYRLVMDDTNNDTFRNAGYDHSQYFSPSLTWNISDATSLTAQYTYLRDRDSYDTELVAPDSNINLVPSITTRYQEPSDYESERASVLALFFKHRFANGWVWNVDTRDVWHTDLAHGFDVTEILKNLLYVGRRARGQINKRGYHYLDTNLHIPADLFGISNKIVVGLTAGKDTADENRTQFYNAPTSGPDSLNISIYNPIYGAVPPLSELPLFAKGHANLLTHRYISTETYGAYLADMITFSDHWKVTLGGRYAQDHQATAELRVPDVPFHSTTNNKFLPMVGLVYQPDDVQSYYASYSTSFVPPSASAIDIHGRNNFAPTFAKQIEVGTKDYFMHHRAFVTLALYQIDERNTFSHFKCPFGTCYEQVGRARSQGAEIEFHARPLENWQLIAGYGYTNAKITESSKLAQVNSRIPNVPYNSAHLWSRYDFTHGPLMGLGFGVGAIYSGQRNGLTPTKIGAPMLKLPAYTRVDAALYYDIGPYLISFKVQNLFNKRYFQSAGFNGDINLLPGAPRLFTLSVRGFFE